MNTRTICCILLLATLWLACKRDRCKKVQCVGHATCFDGQCTCEGGYEGANCDSLSYIKFIGTYWVGETCQGGGGSSTYSMTIIQGFEVEDVQLSNILNSGLSANAEVKGNLMVVPSQELGAFTLEGEGTYESKFNRLTLNVQHNRGGTNQACTLTMTKQ